MEKNVIEPAATAYPLNVAANGHVKIWTVDKDFKNPVLTFNGDNTIVKGGSDILAAALSGVPNSAITHFYVGYNNDGGFTGSAEPAITISDTIASFPTTGDYGYVRIPLSFPASFLTDGSGYTANIPYYTSFLVAGSVFDSYGAEFDNGSKIFALGLVNAQNSSNNSGDRLFSKIYLSPVITYDTAHGAVITWGVTFRSL
jgi:hypothetical protein